MNLHNAIMKRFLVSATLLPAIALAAPKEPPAERSSPLCNALSSLAEAVAQGRSNGVTQAQATKQLVSIGKPVESSLKVVNFVYDSGLSEKDAKRTVMMHCLLGSFK